MTIQTILLRAISPSSILPDGRLTTPRSYGVYELSARAGGAKRYRVGNHPIRLLELEAEFMSCTLMYLFLSRDDAVAVAAELNDSWSHGKSEHPYRRG
jgi:hypothetical protein